jgi:ABC-type uncharacterized transport system ATPase component
MRQKFNCLTHKKEASENYFSLIIGNNGVGKSRLLGSITNKLTGKFKPKRGVITLF